MQLPKMINMQVRSCAADTDACNMAETGLITRARKKGYALKYHVRSLRRSLCIQKAVADVYLTMPSNEVVSQRSARCRLGLDCVDGEAVRYELYKGCPIAGH